jgi:hypothetical protein
MNRLTILAVALLNTLVVAAGDGDYAIFKISPVLMKGANAVIRKQDSRLEINSASRMVYKHHYVITIFNENADDLAEFYMWYDKLRHINSAEGFLYDMNGKQLKKMKFKDLEDRTGGSDNLIDDMRYKRHNFYYKVYPYTIEYFVEQESKSTMTFPSWQPQRRDNISVAHSTFTIDCPENYQFRYKAIKYAGNPVKKNEKGRVESTWEVNNLPAIVRESLGPSWQELTPNVKFAPNDFQIDNYQGNMADWNSFGKFISQLNKDRDKLPDNVRKTVHELTDGLSEKEKINRLYKYLQKNTRYVSIQLGIGGLQPFDASFVASNGYGDCKALSNYMYSLLKEAGIQSCYTLVNSGPASEEIDKDFPADYFNHIILCVPLQKDSIWLECTSQILPAGYLSDHTDNRFVLLVNDKGGNLVRTPRYGIKENLEIRNIKAMLKEDGTLNVKASTHYTALQQDDIQYLINTEAKDKVKEHLHKQLDFATYDIDRFDYRENPGLIPSIDETLDITVKNYATITGKRLFIIPNVMTRTHQKFSVDTSRKYDVVLNLEYQDVDTVEIELPKGYEAESVPKDVAIKSQFGKYNCSVKLSGNKLYYYRNIERFSGRFPAGSYEDLRQFYEAIYKADRNRVVLVKNEQLKAF